MAEDRVPPPPGSPEEPILDISSEDLTAETLPPVGAAPPVPPVPPVPPPPVAEPALPPAPAEAHHDDQEVTIVQEPPAPAGPLAPAGALAPAAPPPPLEAASPPLEVTPLSVEAASLLAPPLVVVAAPAAEVSPAPLEVTPEPSPYQPPPVPEMPPPVPVAPAVEQPPTPVMATDQWYTTSGGQVYGPYSAADIRAWLTSGQMAWDTQASRGGEDPWRPLSAIAEFNPAPAYGVPLGGAVGVPGTKDKTIAGILGIVLGAFGGHHWYLGNYTLAGIYLGVTVLTAGILGGLSAIAGIIEGIIYLTAPEDRFQRNYKKWFLNGP